MKATVSSGIIFDLFNPRFFLTDIAMGLSKQCRYNGQLRSKDIFYSVAEHSVLVAEKAPDYCKREALMHDAQEAYLGDIISPLKAYLPNYQRIEKELQARIFDVMGLNRAYLATVREIDKRVALTEKEQITYSTDDWGPDFDGLDPYIGVKIECLPHDRAYDLFLHKYRELFQ